MSGERELREVVIPSPLWTAPFEESDRTCPRCNGALVFGPIPCPDGRSGCCVNHLGFTCTECGRMFQ